MTTCTAAATAKPRKQTDEPAIRHTATFSGMTADEFRAAKDRQIIDLLRWTAHMAAAGECGVTS